MTTNNVTLIYNEWQGGGCLNEMSFILWLQVIMKIPLKKFEWYQWLSGNVSMKFQNVTLIWIKYRLEIGAFG